MFNLTFFFKNFQIGLLWNHIEIETNIEIDHLPTEKKEVCI